MFAIWFYVPDSHLNAVKDAMFAAGAGKVGHYDCCAWQTEGHGQFRALEGSQPFIGKQNAIETVSEYRVEMVCDDATIDAVMAAMKLAHPYDTPAYGVIKLAAY